jgi:hypothetical protein
MGDPICRVVGRSIDLDCQSLAQAGEIEAIRTNRMLATEFVAAGSQSERLPQANLGRVARAAILARCFDDNAARVEDPTTTLRAVPLPVPGRN